MCTFWCIVMLVTMILTIYWLSKKLLPKPINLKGCHVMITGGSSGIGKSLAREALVRGATVTIIARGQQQLEEAKTELCDKEPETGDQQIHTLSLDISDDSAHVGICIKEHIEKVGPVSMLINCAGISMAASFSDTPPSEFKRLMDVNYLGAVYATHAVLPSMKSLPQGRIVFLSSAAGQAGLYGYSAYSSSKFALRGLAESLQMELTPYGIRVTLAFPADTNTPGFRSQLDTEPLETRLISDSAGVFEADDIAKSIMSDSVKGKFLSSMGFEGRLLTLLTCGMAPVTHVMDMFLEVVSMGVIRLVSLFYLAKFDRIVAKCKTDRDAKKFS